MSTVGAARHEHQRHVRIVGANDVEHVDARRALQVQIADDRVERVVHHPLDRRRSAGDVDDLVALLDHHAHQAPRDVDVVFDEQHGAQLRHLRSKETGGGVRGGRHRHGRRGATGGP